MRTRQLTSLLLSGLLATSAGAAESSLPTPRGAPLQLLAEFPAGPGPFPAVVLASGTGYHLALPALAQTARQLLAQGVAVYRFNWAYFSREPRGKPSADLRDEGEDLATVLAAARAEPRVDKSRLFVGGKSMGTVLAWRALAADPSLRGGLFLTPLCSRVAPGGSEPQDQADQAYPGIGAEARPLLFIAGDRDPLCQPALLYRFAARAGGGTARVAIVGGDHSYESRSLPVPVAEAARERRIDAVARLAAGFVVDVLENAPP